MMLAQSCLLQRLAENADNKGLAIDVQLDDSLPRLAVGDEQRLRQILLNLLSNAIKFTDAGLVRLGAIVEGDTIVIDVEDSRGIAPERYAAFF